MRDHAPGPHVLQDQVGERSADVEGDADHAPSFPGRVACVRDTVARTVLPRKDSLGRSAIRPTLAESMSPARSDPFEKRRALMESWARYLDKAPGDVIELPRMA